MHDHSNHRKTKSQPPHLRWRFPRHNDSCLRSGSYLEKTLLRNHAFSDLPQVEIPYISPDSESAWHLYIIRLNLDKLRVGRETIYKALRAENIGVNVHYIPIHLLSYYQDLGYEKGDCPVAEGAYERLITLPLYPAMNDQDVQDVIDAVNKVTAHFQA